jgi:hypothetical protein
LLGILGLICGVTIGSARVSQGRWSFDTFVNYGSYLAVTFVVLTDAAVLCLLLRDATYVVEVHHVQPGTTIQAAAERLGITLCREGRRLRFDDPNGEDQVPDRAACVELVGKGFPINNAYCIVLSTDGRQLLSGGLECSVRLWDLESGKELARCRGHRAAVRSVSFAPDGRRAVSSGQDFTVRLWDLETGRQLDVFRADRDMIHSVAFSMDGKTVLSASRDGTVRVWQVPE